MTQNKTIADASSTLAGSTILKDIENDNDVKTITTDDQNNSDRISSS